MSLKVFKGLLVVMLIVPLLGFLYWPLVILLFILFIRSLFSRDRIRMILLLLLLIFLEGAVKPIANKTNFLQWIFSDFELSSLVVWPLVETIPIGPGYLTLGLLLMVIGIIESLRYNAILAILVVALTLPGIYMAYMAGYNGFLITLYAIIWLLWLVPLKRRIAKLTISEQYIVWRYLEWFFLIATIGFAIGLTRGHIGFLTVGLSFLSYQSRSIGKLWKVLLVLCHILIFVVGTFTLKAIVILSLIYYLLSSSKILQAFWLKPALIFLLICGLALSVYVPMNSHEVIQSTVETNYFSERLEEKIGADRIPIWVASFQYTFSDLSFFVPSNRVIPLKGMPLLNNEWEVGAHNVFLEFLRQFGIWIGLLLIWIFSIQIYKSIRNSRLSLAMGILVIIFITYGFTGHYLIYSSVGLLFILMLLLNEKTYNSYT